MEGRKLFEVNVNQYNADARFTVCCPASLKHPKDHAVMFVMERCLADIDALKTVRECLVFWPEAVDAPAEIKERHVVIPVKEPRLEFCRFFKENGIRALPPKERFRIVDGAYIAEGAEVPASCTVLPGAYICGQAVLGEHVYVGAGAKIVSPAVIGDHVIIRENTVIGAGGLTMDRDTDNSAISMPQFGKVVIEEKVEIGANVVIACGAIDETRIEMGSKIDNAAFISHNVHIGKNTFVVGNTIFFGGASTGANVFVSGNVAVRNKAAIGEGATVGMGAVVTKNVRPYSTVIGNPAREKQ